MGLLCRKAQASIKSRPSRSGGGSASNPVDESLARHFLGLCKSGSDQAGGRHYQNTRSVNRLVRFRSSLLYLACYQLRLLLHLFLAWQFRQRARSEVTLRDLPLVVLL